MDWENYARKVNASLKRMATEKVNDANFGILYELTANHLRIVARKYLIDKSLDMQVVSDTFLRALDGISGFDEEKNGYNWLCKITKRVALNCNKRTKRNFERNCVLENADMLPNSRETDLDTRMDVEKALDMLDETTREMVYLRFFEGCNYSEIGEKLGVKVSGVKMRIKRNLKKMKSFLE